MLGIPKSAKQTTCRDKWPLGKPKFLHPWLWHALFPTITTEGNDERKKKRKSQRLFDGLRFVHSPKVPPTTQRGLPINLPQSACECSKSSVKWNELCEWATFTGSKNLVFDTKCQVETLIIDHWGLNIMYTKARSWWNCAFFEPPPYRDLRHVICC
jgi:hypothetical protein